MFPFFKKKEPEIPERVPKHVAFVLDGNGRWATKRALPRTAGHKAGATKFEEITEVCHDAGVETITAYAFSTENWKRSKEEIDGIIALLDTYLDDLIEIKYKKNIRLRVLGDNTAFPDYIQEKIRIAEEKTAPNKYNLNLCLNYGGRAELCHAFNRLIERGFTHVTEEDIASEVYTAPTGDRISLSARAATRDFRTFCCGRRRMRNCISRRHYGRISRKRNCMRSFASFQRPIAATAATRRPRRNYRAKI